MTDFLTQYFYWILGTLAVVLAVGISGVFAKKESLTWRFWTIICTALIAGLVSWVIPPQLGIDLAGGTSLLYELDLSKIKTDTTMETSTELANRVIEVLKKRVDPFGQKNMIWRVVGGKRIQIQMPRANEATLNAQKEERAAREDLQASTLKQSEYLSAIKKKGPEREAAIEKLAPRDSDQYKLLMKLAEANDKLQAVQAEIASKELGKVPEDLLKSQFDAQQAFDQAQQAVKGSNVDFGQLSALLSAADNEKNVDAQKQLAELPAKFPRQQAKIERLIKAHKRVMELSGGGVDDPAELRRLVTSAGVLDFRIAVEPTDIGGMGSEGMQSALQSLQQFGPDHQVTAGGIRARWFEIDPNGKDNFRTSGYVISTWAGQPYLLCYDDTPHTLTHSDPARKPWSAQAGAPQVDSRSGGLALPFKLDAVGATYMGDLTSSNTKKPMAILLDDKAMTAPTIQSQINDSGEITFGTPSASHPMEAIRKEADQLKQIMDAGSLPATLQREPISAEEITPDMGADNIRSGLLSGVYALLAVLAFMMVYYTITGAFANLALMLNLLLVLAAMAMFRGTFTLPGIAGLVLTLGMAVDANVLINERIREEIHKGASLWMAIKQGYDKVFWTIFDANLTTSLTSIVLIYVGSEEVKGFGVTLLIGLMIHMFTALYVTRTFMMAAVRWRVLRAIDDHSIGEYFREIFTLTWLRKGHWPFMRVITVTNVDWISKRHIFWVISAIITVAGLVAFLARGEDKYDIEFRGGTQISFTIKPDAAGHYLSLDDVRKRIEGMAEMPGLKELQNARVYQTGGDESHRFEMQTTIKNPEGDPTFVKRTLLDPLAQRFSDVLDVTQKVQIAHDDMDEKRISDLMDLGLVRPITAGTLDQVFAKTPFTNMPNHDVTNYMNGTAIVLDDINPPQSAAKLAERIRNTRQSSDVSAKTPYREFSIIPVTAVAAGSEGGVRTEPAAPDDTRPLTRAVMVSLDTSLPYDVGNEQIWISRVAGSEWNVVRTSMSTEMLFQGVTTFDAVVADQAKQLALLAIALSLVAIVIYVWIRFGGIWYGIGAIFSLAHDAIVAVAATVLSGVVYHYLFRDHPNWLLLSDFKINLTMIAAYLTIIGYSVNDTIVIFDRVRELRGRSSAPLSAKLINDAINQCFGRTIWTTFTVFIVVLIMYIYGGEGIRGFSFAMLIGVITGAYSTLAIASPMLLTASRMADRGGRGPNPPAQRVNPFLRKESEVSGAAPALPQSDGRPDVAPGGA
jgi:SecD/SecF fusion protein